MSNMKKITIVTGHYGTGKTNYSVNLALEAARTGEPVSIVDLDIVNPYFRTADFGRLFAEHGVTMITPDYANSNVDISPASSVTDAQALAYVASAFVPGAVAAGSVTIKAYGKKPKVDLPVVLLIHGKEKS